MKAGIIDTSLKWKQHSSQSSHQCKRIFLRIGFSMISSHTHAYVHICIYMYIYMYVHASIRREMGVKNVCWQLEKLTKVSGFIFTVAFATANYGIC